LFDFAGPVKKRAADGGETEDRNRVSANPDATDIQDRAASDSVDQRSISDEEMEKDLTIPPDLFFIFNVVLTLVSLICLSLIAREAASRLRAGPVRFRLALASKAVGPRGIDALVLLALVVGPIAVIQIGIRKTDLEGTLPLSGMLWYVVWMLSLSSPRRDAKRWLVLASGLLSLVIGAVALAVGLRALQAGKFSTLLVPAPFMLVASVMLFVVGAGAIQEYVTGTRVRDRGIELFRTIQPWSRIIFEDWQALEGGFDLHLTILPPRLFGRLSGRDSEAIVPVPAAERAALEAFLAEHTTAAG